MADEMNTGRKNVGQRPETEAKYRAAVAACSDLRYVSCNLSEIARMFSLSPAGLINQLRAHFPDVIPLREQMREQLGMGA